MEKSVTKSRRKHEEHQSASSKNNDVVVVVASITDLPDHIIMEICSKLSVKSICRFRSVCKNLYNLLTSSGFVQLHFDRAPVCPLICGAPTEWSYFGRHKRSLLRWWEIKLDRILNACSSSSNLLNLTAFMLPRGPQFSYGLRGFNIVNSCNGYLCLEVKLNNDTYRVAIYNPVTSEYSLLPIPENLTTNTKEEDQVSVCGLGYCPNSNQYKVLIFVDLQQGGCSKCFTEWSICNAKVGLIYTLGLKGGGGGWREIKSPPCCSRRSSTYPVFFNGALHWIGRICHESVASKIVKHIMAFDFEGEQFRNLPEPPCLNKRALSLGDMTLGVRRGRLYLCYTTSLDSSLIDMWVMNDYGVGKSWTKEEHVANVKDGGERWSLGLNFSNDWDLLFYSPRRYYIYFIDKHHDSIRYLKIGEPTFDFKVFVRVQRFISLDNVETTFNLKVFAHVPSFISLKNVVGDSLQVFKFGST